MSKSRLIVLCFIMAALLLGSCGQRWGYPTARKGETVDNYFGVQVADPYRWMEADTSQEVKQWVDAERALTDKYLSEISYRDQVKRRLESLLDYDTQGTPFFTGKYYIFAKKTGLSNQAIFYIQDSLSGTPRVLLDPNRLSDDGTVAVAGLSVSNDSRYLAYSIADGGSDWNKVFFLDLLSGEQLDDVLEWVKFSALSWKGHGLYYSRYDAPEKGGELSRKNEFHKVYYHKLGESQTEDQLIFQNRNEPNRSFIAQVTANEKYLFVSESGGTDGNCLYVKNLARDAAFIQLTTGFDYVYNVIGGVGDDIYVLTNFKSPKYKLVRVNMDRTDIGAWEDIIPEQKDVLVSAHLAGGKIIAEHLVDAASRVSIHTMSGELVKELDLGVVGTVGAINSRYEDDEFFYSYTSFTVPTVVNRYVISTGDMREIFRPKFDFNFDDYIVDQVFYQSGNSVRVPMFIVRRKDIELNGKNPTLLYGYGGFNISLTPTFSANRLAWLEQGGIYAVACLRGGGEYGEKWHMSGTKLNKQNVFDDFIAAAEYLIDEGYTSSSKLAIQGGSNGGLLIGAVVNQRPDLFAAAIPQVGVMDMLRYQYFTIGWAWADDYGVSTDEMHFENLYSYSPLHNIKAGDNYPAILVVTADHDDRVVPAHSFKYTATLQELQPTGRPKLIRIETRAGHGAGKPTALLIAEQADIYSFLFRNLNVTPRY